MSSTCASATEETVASIHRIHNVGTVIHSPETAHLIVRLNIGHIGSTIEVPDDAKFFTGQSTTNFKDITDPISMVVNGQLIIEPETRKRRHR